MTSVHLRIILRWLLAAVYVTFGILHLQIAPVLAPMVPHWVPQPLAMIKFTGICEILGGLGLLVAPVRPFAGVMLAIYAVCVYPANLHHAFGHVHIQGMPSSWWYHGPRLAFQPVFVWWALFAGELIDWPLRRRAARRRPA
ncbi:MAG TPA: DoxX family protein [Phenylobacterium sp.]|nr:DoxX family protein [Phenylobacterium sp.]